MKILLFSLEYPPFYGGVANYYANLVKFWPDQAAISVLNNNDGDLIKNWLWPRWLPAVWRLIKTVKKEKINHIMVGQVLPLGTVAYLATFLSPVSYSVVLHGMDLSYALRRTRKKQLTLKILTKADRVICVNSHTAKLAKKFLGQLGRDKVYLVNPGVEPPEISREIIAREKVELTKKYGLAGKIVLLSLGRLVKRKGFDRTIEAMPEASGAVPNLLYLIAGDGPDRNYLERKAQAAENIIFLGAVSPKEKWAWLDLCHIFIMPARDINGDFEGFGIVYLEANLRGKPVIAGSSGGVADAVRGGVNGLLIDPDNKERIAAAIIKLALDHNLRRRLGERGRERAIKEFNWPKQVKKIYQIITK